MRDTERPNLALPRDQRLISLDALRGFDMFWIIGGVPIVKAAAELSGWRWLGWLSGQMHHTKWHGFTFYDLIFPLFLFLAGVSMPFSFSKRLDRGDSKWLICRHIITRGILLVFLGMIYNGLQNFDWAEMRYASVLGRIGLAYMFAALIVINTKWPAQLAWAIGPLIAYWAALKFIPVPGYGPGDLSPGHTLTDYIDRLLLPGKLIHRDRDPEGLLGIVPAISTALAGAITGQLLQTDRWNGYIKSLAMVVAGLSCIALAQLWNSEFPINKNLWSSSFVLQCAGWSLLLLATFYLVLDVWRLRTAALIFVVIGSNSILIYMARRFISFDFTAHALFGGALRNTGIYKPLLSALAVMLVQWLLLLLFYKKRIFVRV
jgi:predicted acyltransferase